MKYLEALQRKKVFSLADVTMLTKNRHTAQSLLQAYKRAGLITSIRRNLYACLDLASKVVLANRFEIACAIHDGACVSYHSALEYHGIANQVFFTVSVTSPGRFTDFSFDGITYQSCSKTINKGCWMPPQNPLVCVTDLERTLVDCLDDMNRAGGLEELIQSIRLIPSLDEAKLVTYLNEYDRIFLWQKMGYMMEQFKPIFHSSDCFLTLCKNHVRECKHYLTDEEGLTYFSSWKLFAPSRLLDMLIEGEKDLV